MGKLRPKEEEGLFWSHTVTKCALTTPRPFLANSTNKNSNNFNLLEVDDVSMSVPNLSFSAPNDKEKTRESFSQGFFVKMSLSSKFRKWEFLSWAWNCTHTHTHTHTHSIQYYWVPCRWLISHQEKNPPEGRDLPLYPSIKVNTLHQPPFCTWTLFSPSSPLDFFRPAFTKQAGCLPHWPRHSLWEVAARSLWAGDTFPPGVTPPSSGLYSHRTPAGRAWSLPPAPQYIGC